MTRFLESLEHRALCSASAPVQAAEAKLVADVIALRSDFEQAYTAYHVNVATIKADLKTLPKTKANAVDVAKLNKASAVAIATESRDLAKLAAGGTAGVIRVRAAYLAELKKPTAAKLARLSATLSALQTSAFTAEIKLTDDISDGESNIADALNTLTAANPSDTALTAAATTAEGQQTTYFEAIDSTLATTNRDIAALIATLSA